MRYRVNIQQLVDNLGTAPSGVLHDDVLLIEAKEFEKIIKNLTVKMKRNFKDELLDDALSLDLTAHEKKYEGSLYRAVSVFLSYVTPAVVESYDVPRYDYANNNDIEDDECLEDWMDSDEDLANYIFKSEKQIQVYILKEIIALAKAQSLDLNKLVFDVMECCMESYAATSAIDEWMEDFERLYKQQAIDRRETMGAFISTLNSISRDDMFNDSDKEAFFYEAIGEIWGSIGPSDVEGFSEMLQLIREDSVPMPSKISLLKAVVKDSWNNKRWWRMYDRYVKHNKKKGEIKT